MDVSDRLMIDIVECLSIVCMYSYCKVIGKLPGLRSSWPVCHWPTPIRMSGVEKGGGGFLSGSSNKRFNMFSFFHETSPITPPYFHKTQFEGS